MTKNEHKKLKFAQNATLQREFKQVSIDTHSRSRRYPMPLALVEDPPVMFLGAGAVLLTMTPQSQGSLRWIEDRTRLDVDMEATSNDLHW
jgi:hypothetical protein